MYEESTEGQQKFMISMLISLSVSNNSYKQLMEKFMYNNDSYR